MKKTILALMVAAMFVGIQPVYADTYQSKTLKYTVDLPAGWHVLDNQRLRTNPELLKAAVDNANKGAWKGSNKTMTEDVRNMVNSGNVEYYVNPQYPGSIITVNQAKGKIPANDADLLKMCESLPSELAQIAGRPMQVYKCEGGSVAGSNGLYLVADGYTPGSKSLQYEIQQSPDQMLIFTAVCKEQGCAEIQQAFSGMVNSLQFEM